MLATSTIRLLDWLSSAIGRLSQGRCEFASGQSQEDDAELQKQSRNDVEEPAS